LTVAGEGNAEGDGWKTLYEMAARWLQRQP